MSVINQAIVVLGLALGLLLAYRAWLIRAEMQDLESLLAKGDRMVQIADEGWAGGFGSINMVCRKGKASHFLVSWRMPCHSEPGACAYPAAIDKSWPGSQSTNDPEKAQKTDATAAVLKFEASDDEVTLASVKLSDMAIARREHGEILVSKRLSERTTKEFVDRMVKSTGKFTINIGRQAEWFYLNSLADTPTRFKQVCGRS
ncbi:MAG: hypothetical protein AAF709_23055 [Pseudomonadota bacterium]